jgi:Tol biopolymer transport system component
VGKRTCAVLIWLLVAVILVACGPTGETSSDRVSVSATPLSNNKPTVAAALCLGRIAYVGRAGGERNIFVVNADGSGLVNLTNGADSERSPSWSPDGARIAFARHVVASDIYTIRPDGSELVRLTDWPSREYAPSWSPDGKQVLFGSTGGNASELFVVGVEGGEAVPLVTGSGAHKPDFAWSPDGSRIAFTMLNGYNQGDVFVMAAPGEMGAAGSGVTNLTQHLAHDCCVSWAPDGERLLFLSSRSGKETKAPVGERWYGSQSTNLLVESAPDSALMASSVEERLITTVMPETPEGIYVIDADSGDVTRLTNGEGKERYASWSPDGKRIAFMSDRTGSDEIYVMTVADGPEAGSGALARLTDSLEDERYPTWSPDGTCLAFVNYHDGESELCVMNVDGGGLTKLTDNADWGSRPSWSP